MKTWQAETVVVALILSVVVLATGGHAREWVGACGVLGSFLHGQVSDRLAESEAARVAPSVSCHRWSGRYFFLREVAWFAYFASGRCWSALVGCVVFLVYPAWRRWWRARNPLSGETSGLAQAVDAGDHRGPNGARQRR